MSENVSNDDTSADDVPSGCSCKVGDTLETYALSGLNDELVDRWTGRSGDRQSLRALERFVNVSVLEAALRRADHSPLEGEVGTLYDRLTDDGAGRIEARRRLERRGVDVDRVTDDFVSHQTIHGHLRECCDAELPESDDDPVEAARETIARLESRLAAVTENTLERLARSGAVSLEAFSVYVTVRISCDECGEYYTLSELLDEGGCSCRTKTET